MFTPTKFAGGPPDRRDRTGTGAAARGGAGEASDEAEVAYGVAFFG